MKLPPIRAVDLNTHDVYLTPLRRRCVYRPKSGDPRTSDHFVFLYVNEAGGFALTNANLRLLVKETT